MKLLTDIYMAKRMGALAILTQAFTEDGDSLPAVLVCILLPLVRIVDF